MRINQQPEMFKNAVFLGGTCATSTWRSQLIPMLDAAVPYFDPQLGPGEWNDEAAALEDACKAEAKVMVHGNNVHFLDHDQCGPGPADGYSVFGQLYEGFEVLDEIAGVDTDRMDRPYDDVIIESVTIEKA